MEPKLISVIVPAFNAGKYLAATLDSIFAQDYGNHEVLLVDDGSTDDTAAIAQSYPGVRYFHQANQGTAVAKNTALSNARGEIIAFLDSDDLWLPHKTRTQVAYLAAHPEVSCAVGKQKNFLTEGVERPFWVSEPMLEDRFLYSLGTVFARPWVFEKIGQFDPAYRSGDDLDWFVRLADAGIPIGWMFDELVTMRRIHTTNLSYGQHKNIESRLRILRASIDRKRARQAAQDVSAA